MPLLRRRPLMRAAMVGGGAYMAGKHVQRNAQHEMDQDAQLAETQQAQYAQPQYAQAPAQPAAPAVDPITALTQLKGLLDSGVLTQDEFDSEKQKILQRS
jgi:membrane protease subunit (stomatin/prohibitin family)